MQAFITALLLAIVAQAAPLPQSAGLPDISSLTGTLGGLTSATGGLNSLTSFLGGLTGGAGGGGSSPPSLPVKRDAQIEDLEGVLAPVTGLLGSHIGSGSGTDLPSLSSLPIKRDAQIEDLDGIIAPVTGLLGSVVSGDTGLDGLGQLSGLLDTNNLGSLLPGGNLLKPPTSGLGSLPLPVKK